MLLVNMYVGRVACVSACCAQLYFSQTFILKFKKKKIPFRVGPNYQTTHKTAAVGNLALQQTFVTHNTKSEDIVFLLTRDGQDLMQLNASPRPPIAKASKPKGSFLLAVDTFPVLPMTCVAGWPHTAITADLPCARPHRNLLLRGDSSGGTTLIYIYGGVFRSPVDVGRTPFLPSSPRSPTRAAPPLGPLCGAAVDVRLWRAAELYPLRCCQINSGVCVCVCVCVCVV